MRRPWRYRDELEDRLSAHRPEPRPEFLGAMVRQFGRRRTGSGLRVAVAMALTVVGLALLGAFGGIGYASSAAHSFVTAVTAKDTSASSNKSTKASQKSSHSKRTVIRSSSLNSSSNDQYVGKTTICHRTESSKNPWVVITVSDNALPAHKAHGDTLVGPGGSCPGPPIP